MQRLEVSGAVRPIYESLGFKRLRTYPSCLLPLVSFHSIFSLYCCISAETSYGQGNRNTNPGGSNSAFVTMSRLHGGQTQRSVKEEVDKSL